MTGMLTIDDIQSHRPCFGGFRRFLSAVREGGFEDGLPLNKVGEALLAKHCYATDLRWAWYSLIGNQHGGQTDTFSMDDKYHDLCRRTLGRDWTYDGYRVLLPKLWAAALVAGLKVAYQDE